MYIRQNRASNRLGTLLGEFGQVPTSTITVTDPVDGAQLTFTASAPEIGALQGLVGAVSAAVGAAKQNRFDDARRAIASAKNLLGPVVSQRDRASFLLNKAEKFVADRENANRTSAGEVLTGVGTILSALAPAAQTAIQTQADAAAARRALRSGQPAFPTQVYYPPATSSNTGLILAVVGGIAVVGLLIVMSKKK